MLAGFVGQLLLSTHTSYIHPDEFFQSFQIVHWRDVPWEVSNNEFINRSIVPLLVFYYPIETLRRALGLTAYQGYLLTRIQFALLSTSCMSYFTYKLAGATTTRTEKIKSLLLTSLNFTTLVFQTHTFSNSIETILLLPTLHALDCNSYAVVGALIAFGTFNRITFIAWLIIPLLTHTKRILKSFTNIISITASFALTTAICVFIDTVHYAPASNNWVIAPLNNVMYNTNASNLATHGLHSLTTHIFLNIPLIIGPMLPLLRFKYTTPTLSLISGVLVHSAFPHQELRFMQPATPLLCMLVSPTAVRKSFFKPILATYVLYNVIASVFFGVLHQGAVVDAMKFIDDLNTDTKVLFWHTYMPPTFIADRVNVVDMMGRDVDAVVKVLQDDHDTVVVEYVVVPDNAVNELHVGELVWHSWLHYDMDHFEFDKNGFSTFKPGLGIYKK